MAKSASIVVSVRMEESDLRKLQLIAQIYGQPVGALIREAVGRYTRVVARTKDFRTKAPEVLRRQTEMLNEFLVASGAIKK
jgi:hypothetical protein